LKVAPENRSAGEPSRRLSQRKITRRPADKRIIIKRDDEGWEKTVLQHLSRDGQVRKGNREKSGFDRIDE